MKQIGACNDIEKLCWAPFESFKGAGKGRRRENNRISNGKYKLKIINLFEILFLKLNFFYSKIIEINHTLCKVQKFSYFFL